MFLYLINLMAACKHPAERENGRHCKKGWRLLYSRTKFRVRFIQKGGVLGISKHAQTQQNQQPASNHDVRHRFSGFRRRMISPLQLPSASPREALPKVCNQTRITKDFSLGCEYRCDFYPCMVDTFETIKWFLPYKNACASTRFTKVASLNYKKHV